MPVVQPHFQIAMHSPVIDTQSTSIAARCIGPYEILRGLGGGAMGAVYLARHKGSGETCALKVLPAHFLTHPGRLTRFKREVSLSLKLDHPHIVRVLDAGLDDVNAGGSQFLVMEYLAGGSLRQQLQRLLLANKAMPVLQVKACAEPQAV